VAEERAGGGGLKAMWVMRGGDDGLIGARVEVARSMLEFGLSGW
jgi:hypothetical protein